MGIATPPLHSIKFLENQNLSNSMSQDYNIFTFSNGFERPQQEQHITQQIRRDKLRVHGFGPPPPPLVAMEEETGGGGLPVYETAGIFSEMFNFPSGTGAAATATELLETQIYRNPRAAAPPASSADWFLHRQNMEVDGGLGDSKNHQTVVNDTANFHHQISSINADSAAAMQLFLMNPHQQKSPSASPSHHPPPPQPFNPAGGGGFGQFTWVSSGGSGSNPNEIQGVVEGQGLSLSLSSSLEAAAKAEELRMGDGGMMFFGHGGGQYQFKNFGGGGEGQNRQFAATSFGGMNILRNSKYSKAAQELLEDLCSVGRGQFKKNKTGSKNSTGGAGGGGDSPASSKDVPPLSASDRLEHQRRKVKLLSMLDEVERRYNHYCEQMQMVVNSFDMIMGYGAAVPYTSLAQKAMSRHFRCLRDAVATQLKHSCEQLGEKDAAASGLTKGETPRLRALEQSLRQQRAFHQMGMMEQEAWRPQRGLPERSVNVLRAWLFEHFLHPYPSDADKHLLARQTGLSRNQVSNWFINARVRLWKPMVEEMYVQEFKETRQHPNGDQNSTTTTTTTSPPATNAQTPTPRPTTNATATSAFTPPPAAGKRSEINAHENDPSYVAFNASGNNIVPAAALPTSSDAVAEAFQAATCRKLHPAVGGFGTGSGDVSLTLGLRHAGNLPEKSHFSVGEFGGC